MWSQESDYLRLIILSWSNRLSLISMPLVGLDLHWFIPDRGDEDAGGCSSIYCWAIQKAEDERGAFHGCTKHRSWPKQYSPVKRICAEAASRLTAFAPAILAWLVFVRNCPARAGKRDGD
jgi:hypothetical protein